MRRTVGFSILQDKSIKANSIVLHEDNISSKKTVRLEAWNERRNWDARVVTASPGLPESVADVTLAVIIHSLTSHARLLFEYECAVRSVITALDHSPDAAAAHFSSAGQCANIPWHILIFLCKRDRRRCYSRWHGFSRAIDCRLAYASVNGHSFLLEICLAIMLCTFYCLITYIQYCVIYM